MNTVLVTGANGFVGLPLCQRLADDGWHVRAGDLASAVVPQFARSVEPTVIPNVTDEVDWSCHLVGVDAVVHLVGRTHVMNDSAIDPLQEYRHINVEGTRRLVEGAIRAGVSRFVFMSSIKAVGEGASQPYTETTPNRPEDAYGISKLEAERLLLSLADASDMSVAVIRPPLVYGPRVRGNLLRLLSLAGRGIPLPLASVRNARSMVYVENLADAVAAVLKHPVDGEVFHVADRDSMSTGALLRRLAELQGKRMRLVPAPVPFLRLAGRLLGREEEIKRLTGSLTVSTRKIRDIVGWNAPYHAKEGLREMVEWFSGQENAGKAQDNPLARHASRAEAA